MASFLWFDGSVPERMEIRQVYGLIFSCDGRLLLQSDGKGYSLAGGKPETWDNNIEDTLRRELIEEINVIIDKPFLVGYQLVDEENGTEPFAQVRMTALIKEIKPSHPDPATGHTYKRLLVSTAKAAELLDWGSVGVSQIHSATEIAKRYFGISCFSDVETIL